MKEKVLDIVYLTISAFLTALAVRLFFTEYALTPGGITGLAITASTITSISVDLISLCISIPLLIISTVFLGGKFGIKTLYVTIMVPLFLRFIPQIHITNSIVLASILGGLLVGLSIGLAIYRECATGGTDVLAMLIRLLLKKVDLATILFILDMIIVLSSWAISKQFITSICSAVALFVIMQTIKFTTGRLDKWKKQSLST
ncbi:MAG: YitT family protein [Anaerorhabdus sp.]|uniref:5xTM membrane BCR, YitT family n=1 Tax=bioreactor metagenome TaxID=1076179 RepID=A0A645ELZ5_9ZZZZ|nr:YitT family protein [Anaerorhabdus sp.]MEA4875831.1 YitT family protein [Anaerorhabdus sp.]